MKTLFSVIAVAAAILMVLFILLQSRGQGLGTTWGGGGGDANLYRSKRGAERILFNGTIVLATIFVLATLLSIIAVH